MKRLLSTLLALSFMLAFPIQNVSAEAQKDDAPSIPTAFVADANYKVERLESGEDMIVLSKTQELDKTGDIHYYETKTFSMISDSSNETAKLIEGISAIKKSAALRGSGSYTDEGWFHGSSVCIESTVNYYTFHSYGFKYGEITSVYVKCSVSNSTILDAISLEICQWGPNEDKDVMEQIATYNIANRSTTTPPSSWVPVIWSSTHGSIIGATVNITVHRGTSAYYTYSFSNDLLN